MLQNASADVCASDYDHFDPPSRIVTRPLNECLACHGRNFVYNGPGSGEPGARVCLDCGAVDASCNYYETRYGRAISTRSSNYKRIHHWHERISQLLLLESAISDDHMDQIHTAFMESEFKVYNKDTIRAILRSLDMQLYIEKWLQIMYRLTGVAPPVPGPVLLDQLDELFLVIQNAFDICSSKNRKNFLNYNYVLCRLLQKMKCYDYCMFFPLMKSKQKLAALDTIWKDMMNFMNWPYAPLAATQPFSVHIPAHGSLSCPRQHASAASTPVGPRLKLLQRGSHTSGRSQRDKSQAKQLPRCSDSFAPQFQRLGLLRKRPRCA